MLAEVRSDEGDGPPLVYVPGIDGTGLLLLGAAERLAAGRRLLCLRYRADDTPAADGYAALAGSVATAVRAAGIGSALVVCESFGGAVGLQLALDHPELVRGLMIVNGFARFPQRARLALTSAVLPHLPRAFLRAGRGAFAPLLFGRRDDPDALRRFRGVRDDWFDAGYGRRLRMIRGLDLLPRLAELRRPVALFASDRDRVVPSVAAAREMASRLPDATQEVLRGAGHLALPLAEEPWPERVDVLERRAARASRT